jgi:8-oxo-dGTP pyrophosphatase MutT (NUDIX family)
MQSYAVVRSDTRVLVAKKRPMNGWWGKAFQAPEKPVNGGGQWALPGGNVNNDDKSFEAAAMREFTEETGISLSNYGCKSQALMTPRRNKYWAFEFTIRDDYLSELAVAINNNLKPRPNHEQRPMSDDVTDWELESVRLVSIAEVSNVLGTPVGEGTSEGLKIDWYGEIAKCIKPAAQGSSHSSAAASSSSSAAASSSPSAAAPWGPTPAPSNSSAAAPAPKDSWRSVSSALSAATPGSLPAAHLGTANALAKPRPFNHTPPALPGSSSATSSSSQPAGGGFGLPNSGLPKPWRRAGPETPEMPKSRSDGKWR